MNCRELLLTHFMAKNQAILPNVDTGISTIQASVLLPIIDYTANLQVLFTERTSHLTHHAGQISFPGGRVEQADTSIIQTCLRETYEEIGIPAQQIQILGSLKHVISSSNFLVTPFVGLIRPPLELHIDPFEVASTFTVPLSFLLDPANHQQQNYLHKGESKQIYVIEYENYRIWGLTARIIVDLVEALAETDKGEF